MNLVDDVLQIACDLAGMAAAVLVVVLEDVDALSGAEPLVEVRGPFALAGAFGIRSADQAERGNVVDILLALTDEHRNVRRRGDQLRQSVGDFWALRFTFDPVAVLPMVLRKLLGPGANNAKVRRTGGVAINVAGGAGAPWLFAGRIIVVATTIASMVGVLGAAVLVLVALILTVILIPLGLVEPGCSVAGARSIGDGFRLGELAKPRACPNLGSDRQAFGPVRQRCNEALEFLNAAKIGSYFDDDFVVDVENNVIAGCLEALHRGGE